MSGSAMTGRITGMDGARCTVRWARLVCEFLTVSAEAVPFCRLAFRPKFGHTHPFDFRN
jgi:hypothetical protein